MIENFMRTVLDSIVQGYGWGHFAIVLVFLIVLFLYERAHVRQLRDKDAEIKRIADARNELEKVILKHRLSTQLDEEGEPKPRDSQQRGIIT